MARSPAGYTVIFITLIRPRLDCGVTTEALYTHAVSLSPPFPKWPCPRGTRGLWSGSLLVRSGDKMHRVQCPDGLTSPALCCAGFAQTLGRGMQLLTCHSEAQRSWIPGAAPPCRWPGQCRSGPSCHTPGQTRERRNRCFGIPPSKDVNPHRMHRAHKSEVGQALGTLSGVPLPCTGTCKSPPRPAQTTQGSLLVRKFCFRWAWGQKQHLAAPQTT